MKLLVLRHDYIGVTYTKPNGIFLEHLSLNTPLIIILYPIELATEPTPTLTMAKSHTKKSRLLRRTADQLRHVMNSLYTDSNQSKLEGLLALKMKNLTEALCNESQIINGIISIIENFEPALNKEQIQYVIEIFPTLPEVEEALISLEDECKRIINRDDWKMLRLSERPRIASTYNEDRVQKRLESYLSEKFAPRSSPSQNDSDKRLRRIDSLARIFSLKASLSVCTAASLVDGALCIATNVSKQGQQQEIIAALKAKQAILTSFLNDAKGSEDASRFIDKNAQPLYKKLHAEGGASVGKPTIVQAIKKLSHAVIVDTTTLTEQDKSTLLSPTSGLFILPSIEEGQAFALVDGAMKKSVPLNISAENTRVKDLHAEQLLINVLKTVKSADVDELAVGITKLCCHTCFEYVQEHGVIVRGQHGQAYPNTINLNNGSAQSELFKTPVRSSPTYADPSPPGSQHQNKQGDKKFSFQVGIGSTSKQLSFFEGVGSDPLDNDSQLFTQGPRRLLVEPVILSYSALNRPFLSGQQTSRREPLHTKVTSETTNEQNLIENFWLWHSCLREQAKITLFGYHLNYSASIWENKPKDLESVLRHAIQERTPCGFRNRSFHVCKKLGWITKESSVDEISTIMQTLNGTPTDLSFSMRSSRRS